MRRENRTLWERLSDGAIHTRQEDEAFQYVARRPREGACGRRSTTTTGAAGPPGDKQVGC